MWTFGFSTCFLIDEELFNGATSQLSDVLKLLDQISLEREDVRKVLHQPELCFLKTSSVSVTCWEIFDLWWMCVKSPESASIYAYFRNLSGWFFCHTRWYMISGNCETLNKQIHHFFRYTNVLTLMDAFLSCIDHSGALFVVFRISRTFKVSPSSPARSLV